jgi:hypothetical protein
MYGAPSAWRARPPGKVRAIAAIFTHIHNVRSKWVRLTTPHLRVPRQLYTPRQARAGLAEITARCTQRPAVVGAASRSFAETPGHRLWPVGLKCCATCFLTKPTIAGRCVCSRVSSDSHCRKRRCTGSGIGKARQTGADTTLTGNSAPAPLGFLPPPAAFRSAPPSPKSYYPGSAAPRRSAASARSPAAAGGARTGPASRSRS